MLTMPPRKKVTGLGKKLRELRDRLGLTQTEAAEKVYVTLRTWARWERGEREPSKAYQALVRAVLGDF